MKLLAPTDADIAQAFRAGARVVCGYPAVVPMAGGGVAALELVATREAGAARWYCRRRLLNGTVVELTSPGDRSLYVAGMLVDGADLGLVDATIAHAPREEDRHTATAEIARAKAAGYAMRVRDAMIRARLLDAIEGWSVMVGHTIDEDEKHGVLSKCADTDILALCLRVTCPSTGRVYVHLVPETMRTAKEARLWLMQIDEEPEVET